VTFPKTSILYVSHCVAPKGRQKKSSNAQHKLFDSKAVNLPAVVIYNVTTEGRIILRWMFKKYSVRKWIGFIWLRIRSNGRLL
jgi:hypothetical protein